MIREPRSVGYSPFAAAIALVIVVAIAAYATPLVNITKPADKEIVSGIADIEVTYTSDGQSPIVRLEIYIDGHLVDDSRLTQPRLQGKQLFRWDFTMATPSTHSISARAMDASGTAGTAGIKVMVQRRPQQAAAVQGVDRTPPTIEIYYPAEGQVVSGEISLKADASDNVGVHTVVFFVDGKLKTMMINSPNYSDRLDTSTMPDGPHVVSASAFDAEDNEGRAEPRTFIVRNHQATVPGSGQERISRVPPKPPVPPPPTLTPPSATGPAVGHDVSPMRDAEPAVPEPAGDLAPLSVAPSAVPPDPTETAIAAAPPTGTRTISMEPEASSGALVTETFGGQGQPLASAPSGAALPAPPSPRAEMSPPESEVKPSTSGLVASLPAYTDSDPVAAADRADVSSPLAGPGRTLPAELALAPSGAEATQVAVLSNDHAVRAAPPLDTVAAPKIGAVPAAKTAVLASPHPRLGYDSQPLGELRQERVAVLPARKMAEEQPRGKLGQPALLDAKTMARFRDVKIVFNGELLSLRTAPCVLEGISMTPLREVFEHTDGVLYWFHVEKRVRAVNPDTELELKIGDPEVKVNGNQEGLVLAPFIKNGRTMVPLEFVARTLDVTISFDSDTGALVISSNKF